jgi:mRNA-degrading endonuclease YafQ of YafQ-DinJ toxin-antitoxin module
MSSSKYDRLFFEKEKTKKQQKVFDELIKALTFALPFEPRFKKRGLERAGRSLKEWKQQRVNQVFTVRFVSEKNTR